MYNLINGDTVMDRKKQLYDIASTLASDGDAAFKYAEHLEELFDNILSEKIGDGFCSAIQNNDYAAAVKVLAGYYREKPDFPLPELSGKGTYNEEEAENCVKGIARVVNIDWEFPEGEVDFLFDPTLIKGPQNYEWLWQFNRHIQWAVMARTYTATGDEKYAIAFQKQLLKWIAQTFLPEPWNAIGSTWRTLECGIRLGRTWPKVFDGFKKSAAVSDTALLLMIASMHRQVVHIIAHPTDANWIMMEQDGAYVFTSLFPEFTDAEANRKIAAERLISEVEAQILPDGMQYELSPDYQGCVVESAARFYSLALCLGYAEGIPDKFVKLLKSAIDAMILLSTPALTQPRTNDTYTIKTSVFAGYGERLIGKNPEYRFVNSNRAEGQPPAGKTASVYLPYGGFAVMRSDFGADAAYLCFDVGPLGMAHFHQDMLNINIFKGSQELIYDDGGGQYDVSEERLYAMSAYGHNTVLVDGLPQNREYPRRYSEPFDAGWITNADFDYAAATYDGVFGNNEAKPATHKREVRFCKPDFFCVSDTLTSVDGNIHDYEALLHLDTTKVKRLDEYKNGVISCFGKEYEVVIIPLDEDSEVELCTVSAAKEPLIQGWYNGRNEAYLHPAITVSRRIRGVKNFRFNTLFIPVKSGEAVPTVRKSNDGKVSVSVKGKEYTFELNNLNT